MQVKKIDLDIEVLGSEEYSPAAAGACCCCCPCCCCCKAEQEVN